MKNMLKRFVAGFSALVMTFGIINVYADEKTEIAEGKAEAYVTFGNKAETKNIAVKLGEENQFYSKNTYVQKGGRDAWIINKPANEHQLVAMYLNVNDSYALNLTKNESYELAIDYYDEGEGWFKVTYDAIIEPWNSGNVSNKTLEMVKLENTKMWKTARFVIEYPKFKNALSKSDIMIHTTDQSKDFSPTEVAISEIRLNKLDTCSKIMVDTSTDHLGNAFFDDENVAVKMDIYNVTTEEQKAEVKVTAYNMEDKLSHEDSFEITLAPGEHLEKMYEYTPTEKSIFKMYTEIVADGIYSSDKLDFSYCVKADTPNPFYGINTHTYTYDWKTPQAQAPLLEKAGISIIREAIRWYNYEVQKGVYGFKPWIAQRLDYWKTFNFDQLLIFANDGGPYIDGWPRGEIAENAVVNFAREFVKEYGDKIKYYEVFNEVQSEIYPGCDAQWYSRILKRVYTAVKEVNPDITIVAGVTSEIPIAWISEVCETAQGYYDAFSIHPYTMEIDPMKGDRYSAVLGCREAMDKSGAEGIPLWLSEIGWPTNFHEYQDQAAYNIQFYAQMSRPELLVDRILYYDFLDDGSKRNYREDCFGIIEEYNYETPYLAKPAYLAACQVNDQLANAELVEVSDREIENLSMYRYKKANGEDALLVWAWPENDEFTFYLGTDEVKVYDLYGTELDVWNEDGKFTLVLDNRPKYIVGHFDNVEITEAVIGISGVEFDIPYDDVLDLKLTRTKDIDVDINVELPESDWITIEKNDGFIGDEAVISLRAKGETGLSEVLTVTLKDKNGKVLREIPVTLNYTEPIEFKFKTQLYNQSNLKRWVGVATVKNNSHSHSIKGKMIFKSPSEFVDKIGFLEIPETAPNETATIKFNLPEIKNYKSYFIDMDILLENGYEKSLNFYSDCSAATYAEIKPVIDGVMSPGEWDDRMSLRLAEGSEYLNFTFGTGSYNGADDLSADIFFEWDEENFYMFAKVKDDIFCQEQLGDGMWLGDSIQFGMTYAGAYKENVQNFTEIGLAKLSTGEYIARYTNENGATGQNKDSELKVTQEGDFTNYELKMPWKELIVDGTEIKGGESIRFNVILNEDDGEGRYGWLEYSSGVGQIKDATLFGSINLMDTRDYSKQAINVNKESFDITYEDTAELIISKRLSDSAIIEVKEPENAKFKILENNGFVENKASIKLQGLGVDGEEDTFTVIVKDESGALLSENDIKLKYNNKVDVKVTTNPVSTDDLDKWTANIKITNNSSEKAIKGKMKFIEPETIANSVPEINIPEIEAGKSADIQIELPPIDFSVYAMKTAITLDDGYSKEYEIFGNWLKASYAVTPPVIDAVKSEGEWDDANCLRLNKSNFHENYTRGGGTYENDEDLSADIYLKWDKKNFYMFAEVTDDTFFPKSEIYHLWHIDKTIPRVESWEGDSLQIGIVSDIEKVSDTSRFSEIGFALLDEYGPWITRYSNESGLSADTEKSKLKVINDGNKTFYEIEIPWTELVANHSEINADDFMRFNIIINENDNEGRYGWLEFTEGIGEVKNPSMFGWLKLAGSNE